jgi:hypothetical protein
MLGTIYSNEITIFQLKKLLDKMNVSYNENDDVFTLSQLVIDNS